MQKHCIFKVFGNKAIRHISTAIRHMWRVANGLDNAVLAYNEFADENTKTIDNSWDRNMGYLPIADKKYEN